MNARILGALVLVALAAPRQADACISGPLPARPFELAGGAALVAESPPPPRAVRAEVVHNEAEEYSGCEAPPKCEAGDYDAVVVTVTPPEGVDPEQIGYRVRVVRGAAPEGLETERAVSTDFGDDLVFFVGPEPLDFTLAVATVDRFGNASEPVEVAVRDAGRPASADDGGCSAASNAASPWLLSLAGIAVLRRRAARR